MTESQEPLPKESGRPAVRVVAFSVLRSIVSVVAVVTVYYLLPLDTTHRWAAITILVVGLIVLIVLIVYSVRSILRSPFPSLRAIEALAITVPLFLVLFAGGYAVMDRITPASFAETLTHTDALYFTVTVFSTVGFGDIAPRTEGARVAVTIQMIMDLVIIGVAIQAIVGAARHGRARKSEKPLSWSVPSRERDGRWTVTDQQWSSKSSWLRADQGLRCAPGSLSWIGRSGFLA